MHVAADPVCNAQETNHCRLRPEPERGCWRAVNKKGAPAICSRDRTQSMNSLLRLTKRESGPSGSSVFGQMRAVSRDQRRSASCKRPCMKLVSCFSDVHACMHAFKSESAGGVRTGGYPKASPVPGPLGCQRPGDWDLLWSPARLALKAIPARPGQLVSAVPGMMSLTRKVRGSSSTVKMQINALCFFSNAVTLHSVRSESCR